MPDKTVPSIEMLGIHSVELPHALGEICVNCFDQQMIVIGHLAEAVNGAIVAFAHHCEHVQPDMPIGLIPIDRNASIAARGHMVEGTRKFESKWACHPVTVLEANSLALSLRSRLPSVEVVYE